MRNPSPAIDRLGGRLVGPLIDRLAAIILTAAAMACGPAAAEPRQAGTEGAMKAATTSGVVRIRRLGVFDDSRTGLGARLAEHIRKRLIRRGIRIDSGAAILLILRPDIVTQRSSSSPGGNDPLSVSPDGQARVSAGPVWRHSKDMGMSRAGKVPANRLGGGRLSLHLRTKLTVLRQVHSIYRIQLQLERDGQAPLWHGAAIAVGRSIDPERAMKKMIDQLLTRLGRPMAYRRFTTR